MLSRVQRSLDHHDARADLSATVKVTQRADAYRAEVRIETREGPGERVIENADCEILADSVALVIALSSAPSPDRPLSLALSAHATLLSGPLPKWALGAGGALAVEGFWALRVELGGSYYVQQSSVYEETKVGARFSLLRLGARGCRLWSVGRFDLAPCVGAQLFRVAGAGFGGAKRDSGASYLWAPAVGAFARLRLTSIFSLTVAADVSVPIARQRFVYADRSVLHQPSAVAFQLFIAPEVQF